MHGLHDDRDRARRIGTRLRQRREEESLSFADVARETGVSVGTIKRFEAFAHAGASTKSFRYEPWGAEYLERWLEGTLTPDIVVKHDLQRVLERDPGLSRKQVQAILPQFYEILDRARRGGER